MAVVGTGLAGGAGIFWMARDEKEPEGMSVQEREELTDDLIQRAQEAMKTLEQKVSDRLEEMPDSRFKREMMSPFEVVRINERNPEPNGTRFHRLASESGKRTTKKEDPYFFYYEAFQRASGDRLAAGWNPVHQIMSLATDFDPKNLMDALVLYHELRHAAQTSNTLLGIKRQEQYDAWLAFHSYKPGEESPRIILNDEAMAYAMEIEMLNLILGGELERKLTAGEEMDREKVAEALNAGSHRRELVLILSLAKDYYFEKFNPAEGFNKHFMDAVYDWYANEGYDIYAVKSNGAMGPYER